MSKKYKGSFATQSTVMALSHEEEYGIIKHDLLKVGILNALYLAFMITLYVTNSKTHYLDQWFAKILHF